MKTPSRIFRLRRSRHGLAGVAVAAALLIGGDAALRVPDAAARDDVDVKIVAADGKDTRVAQKDGKEKAAAKPAAGTGTFKGTVTFDGSPPSLPPLHAKGANVKDPAVCAAEAMPDESLIVDSKTKGIENVFIYLVKAPEGYKPPPPPKDPVVFDQKGCRFLPHALLVRVKQTVLVKSGDPIAHNTHSLPQRSATFNQVIKPEGRDGTPLVYDKSERQPVEVKCDLHNWMRAYHLALDHPFMAVTDASGNFEIQGLPPGKHKFTVWQEKGGYLNRSLTVEIKAGKVAEEKIKYGASALRVFNGPHPRTVSVSSVP